MDSKDIKKRLSQIGGQWAIPEFTWDNLRIDMLLVDLKSRWVRGFEIKVSKADFKNDEKWHLYAEFCSSLSIVCPEGLIEKNEIEKPYGLLWICENKLCPDYPTLRWVRKPIKFNRRNTMSWLFTYLKILEKEIPRLTFQRF